MAVPPRKIRQLPPALPPKGEDVIAVSQMGDNGVPTTRAMTRDQMQSDLIQVIAVARQQFVDTAKLEHEVINNRLAAVEQGLDANTMTDQQMKAALVMLQQMVNGESGKTPYDLWLEAGNTGTMADYLNSLVGPTGARGEKGDSIVGPRGEKGETGAAGIGLQGPTGNPGADGKDSTVPGPQGAPGKDSTVAGPQGIPGKDGKDSVVPGPQGVPGKDSTVPGPKGADSTVPGPQGERGLPGSDATATPLATQMATALGNAAVGISTRAAREDHVHPLPAGRLVYIGEINVTETLLVSLAVGMKRKTFPLTGVAVGDKLQFTPSGTPTAGCEAVNVNSTPTANAVSVGYYTPLLGIGATYTMPISVWKIT